MENRIDVLFPFAMKFESEFKMVGLAIIDYRYPCFSCLHIYTEDYAVDRDGYASSGKCIPNSSLCASYRGIL